MNTSELVRTIGYGGILAILLAESGLLIGFFLSGDTPVIAAGLLAARGRLEFPLLLLGEGIAAVLGDTVGHLIGHEASRRLFWRADSFSFRRIHLQAARRF